MRYVEVNPGEIMSKWYGESEQNIKKVFDDAIEKPPTILAIDEIDAIGRNRGDQSGDSVTPRLLNLILMGMDKVSQGEAEVVVVGTTNKPEILDKALLRPGRFDKVIYVGPPDEKARAEIFRGYLQRREVVSGEIDYDKLAKMSERFTGADIEALVNKIFQRAFYSKVKEKKDEAVTEMTLEEAIKGTRPTIGFSMLEEYERFRAEYQRERRIQKGWESEVPDVKFDEIGGLEEAKDSLRETIELPLKHPDLMEKLKVKPVKGVLLYGPPGNGKTLLAKAVATEIEANFFVVSGADLAKGNAGDAASRIKELFNMAKDNTPAVIFIDEVDQIAPDRSNPMGAMFVPVTTQLLAELDGVKSLQGVMVLAATNRPSEIDPALLRSNRLEKHIEVPNPNVESRRSILGVCLRGVGVADGVSVDELSQLTADFSGAKLQEFVNEAKKAVLRRAIKGELDSSIRMEDFANALRAVKKVGD